MFALGIQYGEVQSSAARALSNFWLAQARLAEQFWGESRAELSAPLFELAGQSRMLAEMVPGGLVLATLAGLALAWRGHFGLAARPLLAAPKPVAGFTFSDHAVWLVVISLALLLIPGA